MVTMKIFRNIIDYLKFKYGNGYTIILPFNKVYIYSNEYEWDCNEEVYQILTENFHKDDYVIFDTVRSTHMDVMVFIRFRHLEQAILFKMMLS